MLDFAWNEILLIGVVALVVVGPKDLPMVLRTAGRWAGRARSMAREFRAQVDQAIRDAELDELRKSVNEVGRMNPLAELESSIQVSKPAETTVPEPHHPEPHQNADGKP